MQDPYCLRCQPQVMGAALDVLRQAAQTLAIEANGVTDNPLIFADDDEALSGGNFHAEPVAFAADMIALAICEIGSLAERRIAMLVDPALSGLPAFLTPKPGLNSGFMIPQVTAAALVSENKQRAYPASVDSIPTSANQEDHVSMAAHGARRLMPMVENAAAVIGDRTAGRGAGLRLPCAADLEPAAGSARARCCAHASPHLDDDRYFHPDIEAATALVRNGAVDRGRRRRRPAIRLRSGAMSEADLAQRRSAATRRCSSACRIPGSTSRPLEPRLVSPWLARKDADWWIERLYDFAGELGATIVRTAISRTVIDVNRDPSGASLYPGQATTELCPTTTFDGEPLYRAGEAPSPAEIAERGARHIRSLSRRLEDGDRAASRPP